MNFGLAAVLILLLVPVSAAWTDPIGDHELGFHLGSVEGIELATWQNAGQAGMYPNADLTDLTFSETQDDLIIKATFADDAPTGIEPTKFYSLRIHFDFELHGFQMAGLMELYQREDLQEYSYMVIGIPDSNDWFWGLTPLSFAQAEYDGGMATVQFPKELFRSPDFKPLREGDVISNIHARASEGSFNNVIGGFSVGGLCSDTTTENPFQISKACGWRVRDSMNDGTAMGDFEILLTPEGVGHLMTIAELPYRASNGLATTYVYNLTVFNFDDEPDTVALQAVEVPKGWEVLHPATVHFDGEGHKSVPVAVSVPFVHKHGESESFSLQALSSRDASVEVSSRLGVFFTDPPQPAGHHDTLFFHAAEDNPWYLWMNTWEDDPEGESEFLDSNDQSNSLVPLERTSWWHLWLRPGRMIGLDFDTSEPAELTAILHSDLDRTATASAQLFVWGDEGIALTEAIEVAVDLKSSNSVELKLSLPMLPEADRLEPFSGNLLLRFGMQADDLPLTDVGFLNPELRPIRLAAEGSNLVLPLLDYHEEVDLSGLDLNVFTVEAEHTFKEVNPGRTAAFVFNITNRLSATQTLVWTLSGDHAEWASVEPAETVVPGGGSGQVVVRVRVPETATLDDAAELLLRGTVKGDESQQVFVRMSALVSTEGDIADEEDVALQAAANIEDQNERLGKKSPVAPWLVFAAIGVALLVRRRR